MTTPPGGPYPPQQPQQYPQQQLRYPQPYPPQQPPYQGPPPGGGGRKALPWIVGAVVVVAALVVTLVLTLGGDDNGDNNGDNKAGGGTPNGSGESNDSGEQFDLSTPEKAAESFAAAAATGDGETLLQLTCMREMACINSMGEQGTEEQLKEVQQKIINGVDELAAQLEGAEFGERTEASIPDAVEIPYRTPDMDDDSYRAFMFVEFEGDWLYAGSAGGGSGGGGGGGGAGPPTT